MSIQENWGFRKTAEMKGLLEENASMNTVKPQDLSEEKQQPQPEQQLEPPPDRYRMAYVIFFILGVGSLLPWNMFITAHDFYSTRFKGTNYATNFENYFSITYMIVNTIFVTIALRFPSSLSFSWPLVISLVVVGISMAISIILALLPKLSGDICFYITIVAISMTGCSTAFLSNSIFAIGSKFPSIHIQGILTGQGFAGTIVSLSQLLTTFANSSSGKPEDVTVGTVLYFSIALAIVVVCIVGYIYLTKLTITQYYVALGVDSNSPIAVVKDEYTLLPSRDQDSDDDIVLPIKTLKVDYLEIFGKIWDLAFAVFFIFFVTLSLFPSITSLITSVNDADGKNRFYHTLFLPTVFLTFNVFDMIGRFLSGWKQLIRHQYVWIASACRLVFFPLFLLSNIVIKDQNPGPIDITPLITSDTAYLIIMALFALTNGYISSLSMMYAPQRVEDIDKEIVGPMMVFFLTAGLTIGSLFSFAIRAFLCWCNPFISS